MNVWIETHPALAGALIAIGVGVLTCVVTWLVSRRERELWFKWTTVGVLRVGAPDVDIRIDGKPLISPHFLMITLEVRGAPNIRIEGAERDLPWRIQVAGAEVVSVTDTSDLSGATVTDDGQIAVSPQILARRARPTLTVLVDGCPTSVAPSEIERLSLRHRGDRRIGTTAMGLGLSVIVYAGLAVAFVCGPSSAGTIGGTGAIFAGTLLILYAVWVPFRR